jgi:hypothetical protein
VPAGLAYDAVSRRFLFGDQAGRRLFVVGEGSGRASDLIRADGGGFEDVTALAIDAKRGDLWVASSATGGDAGAIHRLQLISGRPIAMFPAPKSEAAVRLTDLAIAGNGMILVLDSSASRVLVLRPGATTLEPLIALTIAAPSSISVTDDGRIAYVAYADGIMRLDVQARTASPMTAPSGIDSGNFERIRLHGDALAGVQVQQDGSRGIVRLELNRTGRTIVGGSLILADIGRNGGPTFATISGDDVYYLSAERDAASASEAMNVVVHRLSLR